MKKRAVLGNITLLTLSVALAACGNMNAVIAKDGSYRMDAFVGTRNLDDGAAIGSADSIRPAFSSQVEDDPDVTGIRVSLETTEGKPAATDIVYRLSSDKASRAAGETPILVPRLSGDLPPFDLPADLAVGRYVLIMRVLGADGVLFERRRSVYYLADAQLTLNRIVSYPPGGGTSSTAPLFPPNVKLLLKADIEADKRLDPYVAWYFGTKRIGMGRLADGANQILWTTPTREGFQTVRVELYPEPPTDPKNPDLIGASAEITVATAASAPLPGLSGGTSEYVHLYHFLGDLTDSADSADSRRAFVRTNGAEPVWAPLDDSYGLSLSIAEQYRLELPLVPIRAGGVDSCRIITRLAVLGAGAIWRASFPTISGGEGLQASLVSVDGGLELRLANDQVRRSAFVAISRSSTEEAIVVDVTFTAGTPQATAAISVNGAQSNSITVPLGSALYGSGSVSLGGTDPGLSATMDEMGTSNQTAKAAPARTAVIDELAVMPVVTRLAENKDPVLEI